MSIGQRARSMMQRLTGGGNEYGEVTPEPTRERSPDRETAPRYLQWYEADLQRYEAEDQAMRALGFAGRIYQDGRLVYTGLTRDATAAIFFDHLHPLKPPTLFVISGELRLPQDAINLDGSVDLFSGDHHWNPNEMTASVLVTWLEELAPQSEEETCVSQMPGEKNENHDQ